MDKKMRNRTEASLKILRVLWIPLTVVYALWLSLIGYYAARWFGFVVVPMIGIFYTFCVSLSLTAKTSTLPPERDNPNKQV